MKYLADEARELKRIREIPENINITDNPGTQTNDIMDEVVFDERYNGEESSGEEGGPLNNGGRGAGNDSLSEEESDDDDEEETHHNPNRLPKKSGNLNAHNTLGVKKESGKGARNDRRQQQAISDSDSEANDDLAHI